MSQVGGYQSIIERLYALYLEKGFLLEDEALDLMSSEGVSFVGINRITDRLLSIGVNFSNDTSANDDNDGDEDRTRIDYETIFNEVLAISPEQKTLISYIRTVIPPKSREWRSLIIQMNSGNDYAFCRLFDMYLRVVVKMALQIYKKNGFELSDAIQEGCIGLMCALKQYDGSKHSSLVSYLNFWIQRYMSRAIIDKAGIIRLPAHAFATLQKIKHCKRILFLQNGRAPTLSEIADASETSIETVIEMLDALQTPIHFDYMLETMDNRNMVERYCHNHFFCEEAENDIIRQQIHDLLLTLTDREQNVLSLRYGLYDGKESTLERVSSIIDLTRERVRQIEKEALNKLYVHAKKRHMENSIELIINTSLS